MILLNLLYNTIEHFCCFQSNIPHSYASIDINIDKLNEVRSKLRTENVKVSVNDFITKAVAHALLECPDVNALYQNGQVTNTDIFYNNYLLNCNQLYSF